jgi:hypothetical protein
MDAIETGRNTFTFLVQESATNFAHPCGMLRHPTTTLLSSCGPVDLASKIHGSQNGELVHRVFTQMQGLIVNSMQLTLLITASLVVASNNRNQQVLQTSPLIGNHDLCELSGGQLMQALQVPVMF